MPKTKAPPNIVLISEAEIVRLYWEGLSIKQLTQRVSSMERITQKEAKGRVELAIYMDHMKGRYVDAR